MIQGTLGHQSPSALVQRACTVTVGLPGTSQGLLLACGRGAGLDVSFRIQRSLQVTAGSTKPQPNTCDLRLFGLNPAHRKALAKSTASSSAAGTGTLVIPCVITAGYQQRQTVLFSGELRASQDVSEGPDVIVELSSGDGDTAIASARLNIAVAPGASVAQVLQQVTAALGVQAGNLTKALGQIQGSALAAQIFAKGGALKGSASEILSDLCRSMGFQWSIQNGALSIVPLGQPLDGTATVIDEQHGMIGIPTVDTKGIVTLHTEMSPGLMPGSKLALSSVNASGGYRILSMTTEGDTSIGSTSWGHTITAQRY